MRLVDLDPEGLSAADEILDSAAHDVAKYMAMTARNVDPAAIPEDLAPRLLEDVLRVDGRRSAWELWAGFSARLRALADDPELGDLDGAMKEIRLLVEKSAPDHARIAMLVADTASRITALKREVRGRLREERSR